MPTAHRARVACVAASLVVAAGCAGDEEITLTAGSLALAFESVAHAGLVTVEPSAGHVARLDLREEGGQWRALVTPRWGEPSAFAVAVEPTEVTLTGHAAIGGGSYGSATDDWTRIVLTSDEGGAPTSFSASGDQVVDYGDYFEGGIVSATGSVGPDATAPELELDEEPLFYAPVPALPWDGVRVRAAEGVVADLFVTGLTVTPAGEAAVAASFTTAPTEAAESWAGVVSASGRWPWLSFAGGTTLSVRAASAIDPSGHAAAPFETTIDTLALPAEATAHGFDGVATVASWGAATLLGSGDPACEQSGCVSFGPYEVSFCEADPAGIAGLLAPSQLPGLVVRYRVAMAVQPDAYMPAAASVWLVSPSGESARTDLAPDPATFVQGASGWSTTWTDLVVDASLFSGETVGFAVHAGERTDGCGYGLPPPFYTMTLYVDSITPE